MQPRIHIVGLGPAGLEYLTVQTYRLLKGAKRVFMRTLHHPCAQELAAEGVEVVSFDDAYERGATFEQVYEEIVQTLEQECLLGHDIVYAVPGHPWVAEKTVSLLWAKLASQEKVAVEVHPALSFLDMAFNQLPFDPLDGLLVRDSHELAALTLTGQDWLVIPQVYDRWVAADVKLDLMRVFPAGFEVVVARGLGSAGQEMQRVPLCELDHREFDYLTSVIVPPCPELPSLARLAEIIGALRSPQGCPWDREQDHSSLKQCLIEESYEVVDAIEREDTYNLCEELGDLLLQVVFHAQIAAEQREFNLPDVLAGIIEKMIRRHPHVFADIVVENAEQVLENWEIIKRQEKKQSEPLSSDIFAGIAQSLPALLFAGKTQKKAAQAGFAWPDQAGSRQKVYEELGELEQAVSSGRGIQEEFGDLLFALVNFARFLHLDPEDALRQAVRKFQNRFNRLREKTAQDGWQIEKMTLYKLEEYWKMIKIEENWGKIVDVYNS
ncbi:MAG: nucleoside triphosphate pyrophosphohydrolase [Peptococcaceae bacterium]|nr:nucleoside triphosphate pyrophosphohydrolase [Peptococcaceae bacterium]